MHIRIGRQNLKCAERRQWYNCTRFECERNADENRNRHQNVLMNVKVIASTEFVFVLGTFDFKVKSMFDLQVAWLGTFVQSDKRIQRTNETYKQEIKQISETN